MKYLLTFTGTPATYRAILDRFRADYEIKPDGFGILFFLHSFSGVIILAECADKKSFQALYAYASSWCDLGTFEIVPVLDNKDAKEAFGYTS